ncbi:LOW QUALITY PROTEIN: uncharacterized protein LOC115686684 [Syzygium oleosum]|uniref:LOW QUALITY PROTEIN: uncharacterized protein LOC115686684 n=1 Tax=Syzygium oleosum TaxID=219896 RepID=UPI0011D219B1|nr:LOW QUALITY PROTEIN: uncharacterized protein LOC115686684 [Syzygium oleosum]
MSLSAAFGERLEQLDRTRNQRLALLQAERELQAARSQVLESKRAGMRSREERCLRLERSLASQSLRISALESEIAALDAEYNDNVQRLRALRCEVEELEEAEKEKEGFYRARTGEMKDFKEATNRFVVDCQIRIEELRDELNEVKEKLSIFGSAN